MAPNTVPWEQYAHHVMMMIYDGGVQEAMQIANKEREAYRQEDLN